ncbi:antiviral reverse transcriptase Drt2 [Neisseria zalophi]|uniref:Reverse transcriptase domain-containing protein n=1 Tax=Neisseria zalophi TaxID=640030 RepID=A0A5J6PYC2_9NEIS|nr:antiviral reverse transcriptase Drt2 [Neisseria zalophi]QEY25902.1 hypothetical protein D0T92_04710 [Neisseria zalophi]
MNDYPWFKKRGYLHFDSPMNEEQAYKLVSSPRNVITNSFYPFISHKLSIPKLKKDEDGKLTRDPKPREISYASHKDSHIFSYYAYLLNEKYEELLKNEFKSINNSVLAFRKLGKNNIDFAFQAFKYIKEVKNCTAIALDISNFFGNLDHKILKEKWCKVLGKERLPDDHFSVFKAITQYTTISRDKIYEEFNISLHTPRSNNRKKICSPKEFRELRNKNRTLFENKLFISNKNKGIPQGSPISALLSNIYMIDFDIKLNKKIMELQGLYLRYCDDILCIVPTSEIHNIKEFIEKEKEFIEKEIDNLNLKINSKKTEIISFEYDLNKQKIINEKRLQYLGFILHNESITIRPAAFTKYSRKMKRGVSLAKQTQRKYNRIRQKNNQDNKELFKKKLYTTYSHFGKRNFISYGKKAAKTMNSPQIRKQLKPLWKKLQSKIESE